jgi:hypothetical protein
VVKEMFLNKFIDGLISGLIRRQISLTIWTAIIAAILFAFSSLIGISSVKFDGVLKNGFDVFEATKAEFDEMKLKEPEIETLPKTYVEHKQVGYMAALNWSFYSIVMAPLIVFFAIGTLQAFNKTLSNICERGMARDKDFNLIDYDTLKESWSHHLHNNQVMFLVIVIAAVFFMMHDWWNVVGYPLLNPDQIKATLNDALYEYDWSVAALFKNMFYSPLVSLPTYYSRHLSLLWLSQ